jgi:CrcB protein
VSDRRRLSRFDLGATLRSLSTPVVLDPDIEPEVPGPPRGPSLPHLVLVFLGGFIGTLARYGVVFHHPAPTGSLDPTILLINTSGAFVLGVLGTTLFVRHQEWVGLRLTIATGVLGGWTTYSAVIAGSLTLAHQRAHLATLANLVFEMVVPVLGAGLGLLIGALTSKAVR